MITMVAQSMPFLLCILLAPCCASVAQQRNDAVPQSVAAPAATAHDQPQDSTHVDPLQDQSIMQQHQSSSAVATSTVLGSPTSTMHTTSSAPDDTSDMLPVFKPFIVSGATVRGPVSADLQAELEAEEQAPPHSAFRALLHGSKKAKKYPKCGRCRVVQCGKRGREQYCSGHCRQKKKIFFCDSFRIAAANCFREREPTLEEVMQQPTSSINDYDTVVVTAEAPYIGCADIANRPSGCPARGTRADLPGRPGMTVFASFCRREYYVPGCAAPLLPFGVCDCFFRSPFRGGQIVRGPCRTTELAAGSGVGGADGSPSEDDIVVVPGGEVTQTWFSNFTEPGQEPAYVYDVTASVGGADVGVSLSFFPEMLLYTPDYLQAGQEIPEDYEEDYEADPEQEVLDYTPGLIERDYEFEIYNLPAAEGGVEAAEAVEAAE